MSTLTLTLTLTLKQHSLKQDRPQPWPWPRPRNLLTPSGLQVQSALTTRPRCLIYIYEASGGSRGGVRGARTPLPLFLDQNEARRGKRFSFFFWRAAPPLSQGLDDPPHPAPIWRSGSATGTRMDTDMKLTHFERDSVAGNEVLLRNAMGLSSIIEPTFKSFTKS